MKIFKEFKEFAIKGNVLDLAVGIIIGASFSKIVSVLVDGILMPPIGQLLGGVDFSQLFINISGTDYATLADATAAGAAVIKYGAFLQAVIDFLIVAAAVFILIKFVNMAKRKEEVAKASPPTPPEEILLLREIRDSLKR